MADPTTERFVLRGADPLTQLENEVAELCALNRVHLVERSQRMLRVEGDPAQIQRFVDRHPGWTLSREVSYQLPEQRPVPQRS